MSDENTHDEVTILVEFPEQPGVRSASLADLSAEDLANKSSMALDSAMGTIQGMARRAIDSVKKLSDPPDKVELSFGLKLDIEAGALVAKAGTEAAINVKLVWEREEKPFATIPSAGFVPPKE